MSIVNTIHQLNIYVLIEQYANIANKSKASIKHDRPINSKDRNSQKENVQIIEIS